MTAQQPPFAETDPVASLALATAVATLNAALGGKQDAADAATDAELAALQATLNAAIVALDAEVDALAAAGATDAEVADALAAAGATQAIVNTALDGRLDTLEAALPAIYVQPAQPIVAGPWAWVKTGVSPPELWVEDGMVG